MDIPLDITLETERLTLRAADLSDVDLVWEVSRYEGFNDGMLWEPSENKSEVIQIAERTLDDWMQGKHYSFTVVLKSSGQAFGRIGLDKENTPGVWNIGFWIHPEYWSKGYAKEAAEAVIAFAFERLEARCIETAHAVWNKPSQRVIEKLVLHTCVKIQADL